MSSAASAITDPIVSVIGLVGSLVALLVWQVRHSERRVTKLQDQFVDELRGSREAAVARAVGEAEMHQRYVASIDASAKTLEGVQAAVQAVADAQRRNMDEAKSGALCKYTAKGGSR